MTKQEKAIVIEDLTQLLEQNSVFYITNTQGLNAKDTSDFRRACFKNDIKVKVVKNTLLKKAMERVSAKDFSGLYPALKGNSTLLISETGNAPAKLIKNFRKKSNKPELKAAWIDEAVYLGDQSIDMLINLKSKEELIADIINLLQSPIKNVVLSLKSSGNKLAGIIKTLSEK